MAVCIGGKCDGQRFYLSMEMSHRDVIKIGKDKGPVEIGTSAYDEARDETDLYRPTEWRWENHTLWMLVHVSLSPVQAMKMLMEAYK